MKILSLEVRNFGKLHQFQKSFDGGLNILCEQNGFGKSTLAVFIKAVFYGLPSTTKRDLDENERKKYMPWQGGEYGGWILFECEKGCFRAERYFGSTEAKDSFNLIDVNTGRASDVFSKNLGLELFGIDADGFERSTYLSQRIMEGNLENDTVTAKLAGLLENVDDMGSFDDAVKILDDSRKKYELKGGRGKIQDLQNQISELKQNVDNASHQLEEKKELESKIRLSLAEYQKNENRIKEIEKTVNDEKVRATYLGEYQRRQKIRAEKEEEANQIRQNFGGSIPLEREMNEVEENIRKFAILREKQQAATFPEEDEAQLQKINEEYPCGFPVEEDLEEIRQLTSELHDTLVKKSSFSEQPEESLSDRFKGKEPPTQEEIDEMGDLYSLALALKQEMTKRGEQAAKRISVSAFLFPLLVGVALLAAGILVGEKTLSIPMFIIGGVFAAVGGVLGGIYAASKRERDSGNEELSMLQQEYEEKLSTVENFLKSFDVLPKNRECGPSLALLSTLSDHARENRNKRNLRMNRMEQFDSAISAQIEKITAFFSQYGMNVQPEEFPMALRRLEESKGRANELTNKKKIHEAAYQKYTTELLDLRQDMRLFFDKYPVESSDPAPQNRLKEIRSICDRYARLIQESRAEEVDLQKYVNENHLDLNLVSVSEEKLLDEEQALKIEQENLLAQRERESSRFNMITIETDRIPEWNDEIAKLSAELEQAKANLLILQKTQGFLTSAKEALSTRYLPKMRNSLSEYLALLGNEKISSATIDAAFEVSVEEVGISRDWKSFSQGWRDILQFCARLSLVDTLFSEGETPFLLLDDPFVNLDNDRLEDAKKLLEKLASKYQILHLVCHTDRS